MRIMLGGFMVVLVFLPHTLAHAVEPLALYDDFNAAEIDPDRWVRQAGGAGTELSVQIQDNRLRLFNRSHGKTDSDRGTDDGRLFLTFSNPAAVTAIKTAVRVNDVRATGCRSNPRATSAAAFLGGSFFNTASPTPGSEVNDVVATIGIVRNSNMRVPADVLFAISLVVHCTSADCKESTYLHSRVLGLIKRGEMATLRVQWDPGEHRFIFQRDDDLEVFAPYTLPDTAPPGGRRKGLRITYDAANCTAIPATPRSVTLIEALFEGVFVNESATRAAVR